MIVSDPGRVLFVHVQKTGGISVERVLLDSVPGAVPVRGLRWNRHATYRTILSARPEVADYWSFGFVRNPWARLWSWYSMIQRRQRVAEAGNEVVAESIRMNHFWRTTIASFPTFEAFVLDGPEHFERLRTPQLDYLRDGARRVDFIGRTERLDDDLAQVCRHLGVPALPRAPRVNVGSGGDHRSSYSAQMRDRVGSLFAADVEEFGYRF